MTFHSEQGIQYVSYEVGFYKRTNISNNQTFKSNKIKNFTK